MNCYVAGKLEDYERVRVVQRLCERYGHTITQDWTNGIEQFRDSETGLIHEAPTLEMRKQHAFEDLMGISNSDVLIALGYVRLTGTLVEVGYALAHGIPILLVGWIHHSVFFDLPQITRVRDEEHLEQYLAVL